MHDTERSSTWILSRDERNDGRERVRDALFSLANGYIGIGGAGAVADPSGRPWMVAAGVYDGDGADTHLAQGPVLTAPDACTDRSALRRELDLRTGVVREFAEDGGDTVTCARFVSATRPGIAATRVDAAEHLLDYRLRSPANANSDDGEREGVPWLRVHASDGGVVAATTSQTPPDASDRTARDHFVAYRTSASDRPNEAAACAEAVAARTAGFDLLLAEHTEAWARRWEAADIVIEGDEELQLATRFALFHLMSSSRDDGEAAIGARGLSGLGYRGHVFWDTDVFVVPFLAATRPAAARAALEYRIRRLPQARENARALRRAGARFPWESARSGRDVTPTSARDRSGHLVPIRTGMLEEHITACVAWAAACYIDWTGDAAFAAGPGRELLIDTARYWASRVRLDKFGAHIYGVIGPDEYHEGVDDNAFTNVMARWNLRRAADAVRSTPEAAVTYAEADAWTQLADALVDGYDHDTGIYEQFAGFNRLEPLIIEDVAPRRPIAADLLLGRARTANAQVIKQADVLMLHHLVPEEVAVDSLDANLRYYEPRTAHGSSLSPAIHASLFARARDFRRALDAFRIASRIDLDDLTGSTASGLHLATMGGLWQALTFGVAGVRASSTGLQVDPHLPPDWAALEVRVRYRGVPVHMRAEHRELTITTGGPVVVAFTHGQHQLEAGTTRFTARGTSWEVAR
jgi:trehalose/maltose hydrolase-like predicted phosphorylase